MYRQALIRNVSKIKGTNMGDYGIFGLIHLVAFVYALVQIFGCSASMGRKILWLLVVGLLPLVGLIVWFLAGPGSPKK
jgi:hypothetical protein